jgi:hypothetical protein
MGPLALILNITLADKILINHVPAAYCTQGC